MRLYSHLVSSFHPSESSNGSNALTYSARVSPIPFPCSSLTFQLTMMILSKFLPTKGFSGAVRITAYMVLACLVIGNSLMGMPAKLFNPRLPQVSLLVYFKERYYALAMGA